MGISHPDELVKPEDVKATKIREYPAAIEQSEHYRRTSRSYTKELKHQLDNIAAEVMNEIESEMIDVSLGVRTPHSVKKPKYKSQGARLQELRLRLSQNEVYEELRKSHEEWSDRTQAWVSHSDRLRREFRIKELEMNAGII